MVSVSAVKEWIEVTNGCLAMREEATGNLDSVVQNLLYSKMFSQHFAKSKRQFLLHLYHKHSGTFYKINEPS